MKQIRKTENVETGDSVPVEYPGKLPRGKVFDPSQGREPPKFAVGEHQVIAWLEQEVTGMKFPETKILPIASYDASGQRRRDLLKEVPRRVLFFDKLSFITIAGNLLILQFDIFKTIIRYFSSCVV